MFQIPSNLPNTTPEQRLVAYEEIEQLITVGFLNIPIEINGVFLGYRSSHPSDTKFLRSHGDKISMNRYKNLAISRSIWMVDGQNILCSDSAFVKVHKMVQSLPKNVRSLLFSLYLSFNTRLGDLHEGVEPFAYEAYSRYLWKSLAGALPCDDMVTGVTGTSRLGLNHFQRGWIFFNQAEDTKHTDQSRWASAKLVASAMVGKGVQKINNHDEAIRNREAEYRQQLQDAFFYFKIGAITKQAFKNLIKNRSNLDNRHDDLHEEMMKVVRGEKDEHDLTVEAAAQKMVEESRPKSAPTSIKSMDLISRTRLVGYTKEQLEKMAKEPPFQKNKIIYSEEDVKKREFVDRFVKPVIVPSKIVIQGDSISVSQLSPNESELLNKNNLLEGENSLDTLLKSRKVVLR